MAQVIAGMGSSHAFALMEPSRWDEGRKRTRTRFQRRYGYEPTEPPEVAEEDADDAAARYERIRGGFDFVRDQLEQSAPDALVFIGDDQNEHFTDHVPQIAIYTGADFLTRGDDGSDGSVRYRGDPALAELILNECVEAGIDMTVVRKLPDNVLRAHAFSPILRRIDPEARTPVVPIFVNAIHVPAPNPGRCYCYGQTIRKAVEKYTASSQVAFYASGGLSHYTSGYPFEHYTGPFPFGRVSVEFDRFVVEKMANGSGSETAKLTNQDIIGNGEIEFRSWITMLGAIGDAKPDLMVYEPFYRGRMGMAVAYWSLRGGRGA